MRAFVISLAFTLAAGFSWFSSIQVADAQSSGFPSRPKFKTVQVESTAGQAGIKLYTPSAAVDNKYTILRNGSTGDFAISTATDASPDAPVQNFLVADRTGTATTSLQLIATTITATGSFETPSQVNFLTGISGYHEFVNRNASARGFKWYTGANGTGNTVTLESTGELLINNVRVPKVAHASIATSGASCTVNSTAYGFSSCARNSTGNYTVTWNSIFTVNYPTCTASASGFGFALSNAIATNQVNVQTASTAGAATDAVSFSIICAGF